MAGHSKFKNIMYRKGAQDKKRSKVFSKLSKEITVAAKMGGEDPDANPRLRLAMKTARSLSMPKDNIDRAIKKASSDDEANYENIRYEGYGPGGTAIIVETLTDNRNRTAGSVRSAFAKHGGALAETGSVSFSFDRVGEIVYAMEIADADAVFEAAIEAGAEDVGTSDEGHVITCAFEDIGEVSKALEGSLGESESVNVVWKPQNEIPIDEDKARTMMKLIDVLEDDDDVQTVFSNFEVSDEIMERLTAA